MTHRQEVERFLASGTDSAHEAQDVVVAARRLLSRRYMLLLTSDWWEVLFFRLRELSGYKPETLAGDYLRTIAQDIEFPDG